MKSKITNAGIFLLTVSLLVGGLGQIIAFGDTDYNWLIRPAQYNAYGQLVAGIIGGYIIIRKADRYFTAKYSKPIVNARDRK